MTSRETPESTFEQHRDLGSQVRRNWAGLVGVFAVVAVLVLWVMHLHFNTHIIVQELFVDPVEFGTLPLHVGIYSYIGATTLVVAGALMVFGSWVSGVASSALRKFLGLFGSFILWLGLDDVFMIHEYIGLRLAWLIGSDDVPQDRQWLESFVYGGYVVVWVGLVVIFRHVLLSTDWLFLVLMFGCFGLSVMLDLQGFLSFFPSPQTAGWVTVYDVSEDMAKLTGGFFALVYAAKTSRSAVLIGPAPSVGSI